MSKHTVVVFKSAEVMDAQRDFLESADVALIAYDDLDVDTLLWYVKICSNEFCTVYERKHPFLDKQFYSRNIVECFERGNFYSFSYACEHGLRVMNSASSVYANKFLTFSNSCGYYDSDLDVVMDYELHDADDIVTLHDGKKCHRDDAIFIDEADGYVLENDAIYSQRYGRYILETDAVEASGYGYVLNNDDDFFCCSSCDEYYHISMYAEDDECTHCHVSDSVTSHARGYGTDVTKILGFGDAQNVINGESVFVGIELECLYEEYEEEYKSDLYLCEKSGYAIPTQDASLCSKLGVEFVFKPDNFDNYQEHIDLFTDSYYYPLEIEPGDGYGLHIHVSNHFLSESAKVRIQNFVEIFEFNFRKIGGRKETTYQRAKNASSKMPLKNGNKSKYQMVNILPAKTIEFRFPKSIVKSEHILLNIELAHAITMYCYANFHIFIMGDFNRFVQFVVQNKKEYKHLNAYFSKA